MEMRSSGIAPVHHAGSGGSSGPASRSAPPRLVPPTDRSPAGIATRVASDGSSDIEEASQAVRAPGALGPVAGAVTRSASFPASEVPTPSGLSDNLASNDEADFRAAIGISSARMT